MGKIIGMSIEDKNANETVSIAPLGKLNGFTGLYVGVTYYLATNGSITYVVPSTGFVQIIGIPLTTTDFLLQMGQAIGLEQ